MDSLQDLFVPQPVTQQDLDSRLKASFKHHLGRGYFYNDCNFDDPASYVIIYDTLLSQFGTARGMVEEQIYIKMGEMGIHRVMDQGCGHAVTLSRLLPRFSEQFPNSQFEGYGVSANLKGMWLGRLKRDYDFSDEERVLVEKNGIHPFGSYVPHEEDWPVRYYGIERDVHCVMKDFPFPLDLVISDHTYFHLAAPWLALKRTVDSLSIGGVAMIRTLFTNHVYSLSKKVVEYDSYLDTLKKLNPDYLILNSPFEGANPVLFIQRRGHAQFKTQLQMGFVVEEDTQYLYTFYSDGRGPCSLISLGDY